MKLFKTNMKKIQKSKEELIEILQDPQARLVETVASVRPGKDRNEDFLTYSCIIETCKVEFIVNPSL